MPVYGSNKVARDELAEAGSHARSNLAELFYPMHIQGKASLQQQRDKLITLPDWSEYCPIAHIVAETQSVI